MPKGRYIIVIDGTGVYLRRTLCVTHHGETGEVQYDSKPAYPSKAPLRIRKAFYAVQALVATSTTASREGKE